MCDLSLQWNDHSSIFLGLVSSLLEKHRFSDATIACNGQVYPVHKFVLSASSNYFNTIFEDSQTAHQHPVLILKDISQEILEALLKYMYIGHASINHEKFDDLISAAASLQIKGLDVTNTQKKSESIRDHDESIIPSRFSEGHATTTGHRPSTTENCSKQGGCSNQNVSHEPCVGENTFLMNVPKEDLISVRGKHNAGHARRGGGRAKRGRPFSQAGKRLYSQRDSTLCLPCAKRSSSDLPLLPRVSPNPATSPSQLPDGPGLNCVSTASIKQELLAGAAQSHQVDALQIGIVPSIPSDPYFPAVQGHPFPHQQAVNDEPIMESPSSSLRSFRLTAVTPKVQQAQESKSPLPDVRIVSDMEIMTAKPLDSTIPSNCSSTANVGEHSLPSTNKLVDLRFMAEIGHHQMSAQSEEIPSHSSLPSSSSHFSLPIITSCYSVLPQTSEQSPLTSVAPDPTHSPQTRILVDLCPLSALPSKREFSAPGLQMLPTLPDVHHVMESSAGVVLPLIQSLSLVNSSLCDTFQGQNLTHEEEEMEIELRNICLSSDSPIKPCSVLLKRISPKKSDSVNEVCSDRMPKKNKVFECLKCCFSTICQNDFMKHIINSCSYTSSLNCKQECIDVSKKSEVPADNQAEIAVHDIEDDASVTQSIENYGPAGTMYQCKHCNSQFKKMSCMIEHQKVHTMSKKYYKCPNCHYLAHSSVRLKLHLVKRKPGEVHRCSYCDYTACSARLITCHLRRALQSKENELTSDVSSVAFEWPKTAYKSPTDLSADKNLPLPHSKKKKYSCHKCGSVFSSHHCLVNHEMHTGHGADKPHTCGICEFSTISLSALNNHMNRHRLKATFACKHCSFSCASKITFKKHLSAHKRTGMQSIATTCTVIEGIQFDTSGLGCNRNVLSNDGVENFDKWDFSFNVEEFQKECSNKLLPYKKTQPHSLKPQTETIALTNSRPQGETLSLDNMDPQGASSSLSNIDPQGATLSLGNIDPQGETLSLGNMEHQSETVLLSNTDPEKSLLRSNTVPQEEILSLSSTACQGETLLLRNLEPQGERDFIAYQPWSSGSDIVTYQHAPERDIVAEQPMAARGEKHLSRILKQPDDIDECTD